MMCCLVNLNKKEQQQNNEMKWKKCYEKTSPASTAPQHHPHQHNTAISPSKQRKAIPAIAKARQTAYYVSVDASPLRDRRAPFVRLFARTYYAEHLFVEHFSLVCDSVLKWIVNRLDVNRVYLWKKVCN